MKRRRALQQILLATAAAALLPACNFQKKAAATPLTHLKIDGDQEELLGQILDALLPSDATPGAKSLNLAGFVLTMVDDCYDLKTQQEFATGLGQFDAACIKQQKKSFGDCTPPERVAFLNYLNAATGKAEDATPKELIATFKLTRQLAIQGFLTSQYVMESEGYEFVPARFHGCVDLPKPKVAA